ncbi:MAG: 4Fe-4S binding protein [Vallitaleaceae bacterium]|jgi:NAD-dependent dihydropyrimidine dehydrogenase PreA subunit|nr:4Fe-4S binding protein [Vallitaleaceae bacterium]
MQNMFLLTFPSEESGQSVTYDLIKMFDLKINILRASIESDAKGFLLIDIVGSLDRIDEVTAFLEANHVSATRITAAIQIDEDSCVDCGACTAVCKAGALYMDKDWSLQFDNEGCLDCKVCIEACPVRAISAVF